MRVPRMRAIDEPPLHPEASSQVPPFRACGSPRGIRLCSEKGAAVVVRDGRGARSSRVVRDAGPGERILSETQVLRLLACIPTERNQVLLRLLHVAGLRVSEIAELRWRDL